MKTLKITALALLLPTLASAYDNLFVFGDSLSDVGNVANTRRFNDGGRWSNGAVWCEYLAGMLGVKTATPSGYYENGDTFATGNINFANGGGMAKFGTTSITGILSVDEQILGEKNAIDHIIDPDKGFDRYGKNFGAKDLVAVWAGANNLFFSGQVLIFEKFEEAARNAAEAMLVNISNLAQRGAKNMLLLNLPDIGKTPCYANDAAGALNASLFSRIFNETLEAGLADIKSAHSDLDLIFVDMFELFNEIIDNPGAYGFDDAASYLLAEFTDAESPPTDEEAAQYLFYDEVHPTTAGHQKLAELIYAQVIPEPAEYAALFGMLALMLAAWRRRARKTS